MPECPEGKLIDRTGKEWACEKKCLGGECATVTGEEAMAVDCRVKIQQQT